MPAGQIGQRYSVRELVVGIGMEIAMQADVSPSVILDWRSRQGRLAAGESSRASMTYPSMAWNIAQVQPITGEVDTPVRLKIVHPGQDTPVESR